MKKYLILIALVAGGFSPELASILSSPAAQAGEGVGGWKNDQAHALIEADKSYSIVDINDRFLIKSSASGPRISVAFGILDGTRKKFGSCGGDNSIKPGERHTTWLRVSYATSADGSSYDVEIKRTLDFSFHDRSYLFKYTGGVSAAQLDPGVSIEINNYVLTYTQKVDPIGTSGDIKSLRIKYELAKKYNNITSNVQTNTSSWQVSTNYIDGRPAYSVNSHRIYGRGEIIAHPVENISQYLQPHAGVAGLFERASDAPKRPANNIGDVKTKDESAPLCNQGLRCTGDAICRSQGQVLCHCSGQTGVCIL